MTRWVAAAVALLLASTATPANAFVAEITTSVAVGDAHDTATIEQAIETAVERVLQSAIAFKPTVAILTHALVIGGRLYVRLLVADQDGEQTFGALENAPAAPTAPTPEQRI